jgi:hypothetical protein
LLKNAKRMGHPARDCAWVAGKDGSGPSWPLVGFGGLV